MLIQDTSMPQFDNETQCKILYGTSFKLAIPFKHKILVEYF